jgi:hypothetical protein
MSPVLALSDLRWTGLEKQGYLTSPIEADAWVDGRMDGSACSQSCGDERTAQERTGQPNRRCGCAGSQLTV